MLKDRGEFDSLDKSLEALKTLQAAMHIEDLVEGNLGNVVEYTTVSGSVSGFGLVKRDDYAVCVATGSEGAIFSEHFHESSVEHLIALTATIVVTIIGSDPNADVVHRLSPGDDIKIDICCVHRVEWESAGDILAVTIPADAGFPDGR